jgi:DNA-binding response OmpR family regulator
MWCCVAVVNVLVVEDDEGIASALVRGLRREGYDVMWAATAAQAERSMPAHVVILDLGLPDRDGLELCRTLRASSDAAILVVTARADEFDRVAALDVGADDYVVKPFGFAELFARIRAVLRRTQPTDDVIVHGRLRIDLRAHQVTADDTNVALTPKEFDILACLASDPGRVFTREEVFARVWGGQWYGPTKVLDVHVASLRSKLGRADVIETVYARGFRLGQPA